jgi:hypothetical protein
MGAIPISECTELAEALAEALPLKHKLFAVQVASGLSYRESARRVGFHEDHGHRLMRKPAVRARVEELRDAPEEERTRAGIDAELMMLRNRAATEDLKAEGRANVELRLKVLMAHARYRGRISDRKQVASAKPDFDRMSRAELDAMLERELPLLDPAMQERIKRIAGGEDDPLAARPRTQ